MDDLELALRKELGNSVVGPGTDAYGNAMASIFFTDASLSRPACIVQPRSPGDVATTLNVARSEGVARKLEEGV
jgi:hypothetical protein